MLKVHTVYSRDLYLILTLHAPLSSLFALDLKVSPPMSLTPWIKTSSTLRTLASAPKVFVDRQNMLTIPA